MHVSVRFRHFLTFNLFAGLSIGISLAPCAAQTASTAAKPSATTTSGTSSFSIETEMLTYRALESNSEAIACDVAGVVGGVKPDFSHPSGGSPCAPPPGAAAQAIIILLPFEKTELEEFEAWHAAMVTLAELQNKAYALGCPKPTGEKDSSARDGSSKSGSASTSTSPLSSFLSLSPAGPPLALAQSVLGLLESQEATISVAGNIEDLAFLNNVARQLRILHVGVITPSSYGPGNLSASDASTSPFLASKQRALLARGCLSHLTAAENPDTASVQQAITDIDDYMNSLASDKPAKATSASGSTAGSSSGGSTASGNGGGSGSQSSASSATAISPLTAILRADGLAQKLGFHFNTVTGQLTPPPPGRYLLMVKALESGGSITGKSNILGTRLRYSGGAVGTYALFAADGDLACSGNVYDYAGPLEAKHFQRDLRNFHLDSAQQVILHSGTCPVAGTSAPSLPPSNPIK
jgi:hypothetical protein